ncbi:hypothetical protein [Methylacidiphilum caldifontis]|uniref:Uncharacterized protein n=1 Tax=Methylacidiphilum caldifontis TaxID=2795386 RepID=A0A4Y8PGA1_9BACT|nr:hypothetical protein [Methylacidiphilum caldifontis]QSR89584.1 hypothetical protein IT6_04765 [Methylacidiphilum caldifontis]TFE71149.1 hypothetical protein A7Q10_05300 [Methylacidiphilum caldifontis]
MGSRWIVCFFAFSLCFFSLFKGGRLWAYSSKSAFGQPPNTSPSKTAYIHRKEFEALLPKKKKCSRGMCARIVRSCIERLIGRPIERRDYAKEYGEALVKTGFYREAPPHLQPRDFDVHILYPRKRSHYGHMEIFYKGRWYSDFNQPASLWQLWPKEYSRLKLYRLAYSQGPVPNQSIKRSPRSAQRFAQSNFY